MKLIYMSLTGGILILLVLLLRALLQNRVHRSVWLVLWAVAVLRLLLPVQIASPTSLWNLPMFRQEQTVQTLPEQTTVSVPAQMSSAEQAAPQPAQAVTFRQLLPVIWLFGAAALLTFCLITHLRARKQYRKSQPIRLNIPLPKRVQLRQTAYAGAPLTYGLLRPVILLPMKLPEEETALDAIVQHELSHIRHADVLKKAILVLTLALHWFNPLVWVMFYVASQDMEMRCDADAVRAMDGQKKAYATMLVRAEEQKLFGLLQAGVSFNSTAGRLKALSKGKPGRAASILSTVLIAAVMLLGLSTAQMPAKAAATKATPPAAITMQCPAGKEATSQQEASAASMPTREEQPAETIVPQEMTELPAEEETLPAEIEPTKPPEQTQSEAPPEPTELPQLTESAQEAEQAQLPTSYTITSPGQITIRSGETTSFSFSTVMNLAFSCDGIPVYYDCYSEIINHSDGIYIFSQTKNYSISIVGTVPGTYTITYQVIQTGATGTWAIVTVLP